MEAGNKTWVFVMAGEMAGNIWNCENIGVLHRNGWDFFGNGWVMAEILGFSKEMAEKWEMMKFFGGFYRGMGETWLEMAEILKFWREMAEKVWKLLKILEFWREMGEKVRNG